MRRIAVRCPTKAGGWAVSVLISALAPQDGLALTRQPVDRVSDSTSVLLAYVYFYDQRGGGGETANKEDKQGLGLSKRQKKRFEAQQIVVLLSALAHNVLVWARRWLAPHHPRLVQYGIKLLVRDLFQISGSVVSSETDQIVAVVLNQAAPLAAGLVAALRGEQDLQGIVVSLGAPSEHGG